jgi:hypothetical protein
MFDASCPKYTHRKLRWDSADRRLPDAGAGVAPSSGREPFEGRNTGIGPR